MIHACDLENYWPKLYNKIKAKAASKSERADKRKRASPVVESPQQVGPGAGVAAGPPAKDPATQEQQESSHPAVRPGHILAVPLCLGTNATWLGSEPLPVSKAPVRETPVLVVQPMWPTMGDESTTSTYEDQNEASTVNTPKPQAWTDPCTSVGARCGGEDKRPSLSHPDSRVSTLSCERGPILGSTDDGDSSLKLFEYWASFPMTDEDTKCFFGERTACSEPQEPLPTPNRVPTSGDADAQSTVSDDIQLEDGGSAWFTWLNSVE